MKQSHNQCGCKVGRVADEFGLADLDEELVARRTGASGERTSLRDLADYFNRAVLRRALEDAGESPLEGEVENVYRLLTADDVSRGTRVRTRKRLERDGVDLDDVESSFVTHPTMSNHLTDCLDVEQPRATGSRPETAKERIFKMQTRAERVIENALEGLAGAGHVVAGTLAVTVDVQVTCEECGLHRGVSAFIERGGCDCGRDAGTDDV